VLVEARNFYYDNFTILAELERLPMTKPVKSRNRTPLDRMTDLTRRLVAVPKSEIPAKRKKAKQKRH